MKRPEPNPDMIFTAWLLKNIWLMAVPPILLLLACVFKEQIDVFTKTIWFQAIAAYSLGVITLAFAWWGLRRTWFRLIKKSR